MAVTNLLLIEAKYAETSSTVEYTSPDGSSTLIDKFTATNVSATGTTITINIVESGETPDAENTIVEEKVVAAGATALLPEMVGQFMRAGSSIYVTAGNAASVTIRSSGRQIS